MSWHISHLFVLIFNEISRPEIIRRGVDCTALFCGFVIIVRVSFESLRKIKGAFIYEFIVLKVKFLRGLLYDSDDLFCTSSIEGHA